MVLFQNVLTFIRNAIYLIAKQRAASDSDATPRRANWSSPPAKLSKWQSHLAQDKGDSVSPFEDKRRMYAHQDSDRS